MIPAAPDENAKQPRRRWPGRPWPVPTALPAAFLVHTLPAALALPGASLSMPSAEA